jgi:kinesin family protein 14
MIEGDEHCRVSRINLIDLAGSERSAVSLTSGERLKEGASINKSLHTLGKVISLLSEKSTGKRKKVYIPYRDSTLTWLLKESLGGNSKTAMIATISPADLHHDESLSTLRYAQQARSIVNIARINEDHSSRLIRELRQEIEWLKTQLGFEGDIHSILRSHEEVQQLKEKLNEYEKLMKEMTISWEERLRKTEERKREEADQLKKAGVSFKVDNRQPNLVNLNDDPQLSEMLLYVLKQGDTSVGRSPQCDIQLTAPLVAKDHCVFHNVKDIVSIEPSGNTEAQTFVNGELISGTKVLHHGDRVIIAGGHYFRFNHPLEVDKNTTLSKGHKKDFHYARDEFIKTQTAKLEAERLKERQEMMKELDAVRVAAEEQITQQKHNYEKKLHHLETTLVSKSSEVDEREKEMTEAEEKISQLERINEELREETIAQRHVIEMEKLKAQREYEEITLESSRLMEELALEKQKLEEDIELLQKSKANREKQKDTHVSSIDFIQGSELLRIATMLQEANIISKNLVKPFNFSREEDYDEDQVTVRVRVTNTQENTFTFWDLEKFETRLEQIREIYQHNGSLTSLDHDTFQLEDEWIKLVGDSDPFHDPADVWHQDSFLAGFSPRSSADGGRIISLVSSPAYKGSPHRTLSDITSSIPKRLLNTSSPLVNRSNLSNGFLYDSGGGANEEWSPPINHVNGFIQICYDNVSSLIQHKHRRDVGLIEMIINHVLDFISIVEILQDTSKDDCQLKVLELTNSLHIILNCGNMLEAAIGSAGGDEYIKDCNGVDCCIELIDTITTQTSLYCSKLLQSILSDSFDEINENCSNLIESLKEILTAIGKIVLVSHVQEKQVKLVIPPLEDHILSLIQNGYQTWCTAFMDKLLQQLYHYCQRDETPATSLYHQLLIQIVTSIAQFVHKISTLQELFWVPLEGSNIWSLGSLLPLLRGLSKIHSLVHLMFCSGEDLRQLSSCNDRLGQVMEEVGVGILGVTRRVSYGEADGEIQAMVRGIAMATKSLRKMLKEEETKPRTINVVI